MTRRSTDDGFGTFFRRYTKTWVHAVATAALTGLGILTFVHRAFAVIAVTAYVAPPIVLYLRGSSAIDASGADHPDAAGHDPDSVANDPNAAAHDPSTAANDPNSAADDRAPADRERTAGSDGSASDDSGSRGDDDTGAASTWATSNVPTDETLHDVAVAGDSAYAVGADGGVVVGEVGADAWSVVLDDGPGADSNALRGVDAAGAAGSEAGIWFAGDDGALGRLAPESHRHVDHSAPDGDTNSITDVAAASDGATEIVLLADGSGRVRRGQFHDGEIAWEAPVTPGSGSSLVAVAMVDASTAYACDSSQSVFRSRDGGRSFERIGVDGAAGTLTDVATATTADEECVASADDGVVHRYDGTNWTPTGIDDGSIRAIATARGGWLACGDRGVVYERGSGASGWQRVATPAAGALQGCDLGESAAIAVGDTGTVVVRGSGASIHPDR